MIARLRGRLAGTAGSGVIIDVNGVGYLVHATPSVLRLGPGEVTVQVHTVVREDALQLYGFAAAEERELFELLLGVNGVGPKVALSIISGSTPAELRRAIAKDDVKRFQAIPGIGLKTAQRVVRQHPWHVALRRPPLPWTIPYPHAAVPGSMPRTFTATR